MKKTRCLFTDFSRAQRFRNLHSWPHRAMMPHSVFRLTSSGTRHEKHRHCHFLWLFLLFLATLLRNLASPFEKSTVNAPVTPCWEPISTVTTTSEPRPERTPHGLRIGGLRPALPEWQLLFRNPSMGDRSPKPATYASAWRHASSTRPRRASRYPAMNDAGFNREDLLRMSSSTASEVSVQRETLHRHRPDMPASCSKHAPLLRREKPPRSMGTAGTNARNPSGENEGELSATSRQMAIADISARTTCLSFQPAERTCRKQIASTPASKTSCVLVSPGRAM